MVNEQYKKMLEGKSVIRQLSEFASARGKEIGYENVFDYSLGNPSVPVPEKFTEVLIELLKTKDSMELHGYSPSLGIESVREQIAESLNRRFGMNYTGNHIFMTTGAAGAIAHAVRCVSEPGDEILTFAPYFPEYGPYINLTGAVLKVVPADTKSFQINFEAFEEMLTEKVAALLLSSVSASEGETVPLRFEKMADELDITRNALEQTLGELAKRGTIELAENAIVIRNRRALEAMVAPQ